MRKMSYNDRCAFEAFAAKFLKFYKRASELYAGGIESAADDLIEQAEAVLSDARAAGFDSDEIIAYAV